MFDEDQRLAFRIDTGAVEGMDRYDTDILRQVFLEGLHLWSFA